MIREATADDDAVMDAIAREGDASAEADYLALVRSQGGRLLVAELGSRVIAYGGVVDVDGVTMLCDLFVAADQRGSRVGSLLLHELFDGTRHRMTFSSKHPAALAAYRRTGMEPRWRLLYLKGAAIGDGPERPTTPWQHQRMGLVDEMARQGAHVSADVVTLPYEEGVWVIRLQAARPVEALTSVLASLPSGSVVTMCTPEHSPIAEWAQHRDFVQTDYDTFCATPGVELPPDLHCLDPGLA